MDDKAVYLVPLGSGRFDLYTEPAAEAEPDADARERAGFWRRRAHQFHEGWRHTSRAAYASRGTDASRLARLRDWLVCRIADSIAEQRTLWALRDLTSASFVYPADLSEMAAAASRDRLLAAASRHHGSWLAVNLAGVALTAVLVLLPGPNLIGYYFAFRVIGHFLSWRGSRQAMDRVAWRARGEPMLTELGQLASLPRADRTERVSYIAVHLGLPRLESFFDRAAVAPR